MDENNETGSTGLTPQLEGKVVELDDEKTEPKQAETVQESSMSAISVISEEPAENAGSEDIVLEERTASQTPVVETPSAEQPLQEQALAEPKVKPAKRKRLAQDVIGKLEDEIADSPTNVELWRRLVAEVKNKGNLEEVRAAFERMVAMFPTSAETWIDYIGIELENDEFHNVEQLFSRCLTKVPNVKLWEFYLGYVRRMNNISIDGDKARTTISQAYEFILERIGIDVESGPIWNQYLEFIRGKDTSTTWEEQQKMDLLRKTYRRAIVIPLKNLETLWQTYNTFENNLNKTTARKFINEKSGSYMNARGALRELQNITRGISRDTTPNPRKWTAAEQTEADQWMKWVEWEKINPLGLENANELRARVKFAYSQAMMSLRYFPEVFFSAANYAVQQDAVDDTIEYLNTGIQANPTSFLLSLKLAEVYESQHKINELKATFEVLIKNLKTERARLTRRLEEEEDDETQNIKSQKELESNARDVTIAYTHYMKAMERAQGIKEARRIFGEARKLAYSTFHIYVASARMEYHSNKEPVVASKIFEVGLKRFGDNPEFVKIYFDFLVLINDETNARALFEKSVVKMDPVTAKPLYDHLLQYEGSYGELSTLLKLEQRYIQLYPETSPVELFSNRHEVLGINPIGEIDLGERYKAGPAKPRKPQAAEQLNDKESYGDDEPPTKRSRENDTPGPLIEQVDQVILPSDVLVLLKALPPANAGYGPVSFDAGKLVKLIRDVHIPNHLLD